MTVTSTASTALPTPNPNITPTRNGSINPPDRRRTAVGAGFKPAPTTLREGLPAVGVSGEDEERSERRLTTRTA